MKEIVFDGFMIVLPLINYSFQVYKFNKTKSSKGFSKHSCLVTILVHTLKVFFWFCEQFKNTLLIQSISIIIMQLYLIFLCIKYQEKEINYEEIPNENDTSINSDITRKLRKLKNIFNIKLIWKWKDIFEYYIFYLVILVLLSISSLIFSDNYYYSFLIGLFCMVLEAFGSLPQIIELFRTKNQKNISKIMVSMWIIGNLIKVYYNIYYNSPIQLIIGAYLQVFFNIILIAQIIFYYCMDKKRTNEIFMNKFNTNKILFDANSNDSKNINENAI